MLPLDDFAVVTVRPDLTEIDEPLQAATVADWYCLKIKRWKCVGCGQSFRHATANDHLNAEHLIVVWPARDDPNMHSWIGAHFGGEAAIVLYEDALGPCVSYYEIVPS